MEIILTKREGSLKKGSLPQYLGLISILKSIEMNQHQ
jgi:hypothetical protein